MGDWRGYGVHTVAMALRVFGPDVVRVADTGAPGARTVALDYGSSRRAIVDVREAANGYEALGWTFAVRAGDDQDYVVGRVTDFEGFYANLMRRTAAFFRTREVDMAVEEALAVVRVLQAAERSLSGDGQWVRAGG
jgi:hypothetical protein